MVPGGLLPCETMSDISHISYLKQIQSLKPELVGGVAEV